MKIERNLKPNPDGNWQDHLLVLWDLRHPSKLAPHSIQDRAEERLQALRGTNEPLKPIAAFDVGDESSTILYQDGWFIRFQDYLVEIGTVVSITISC